MTAGDSFLDESYQGGSSRPLSNVMATFIIASEQQLSLTEIMIGNTEQQWQGTHFEPRMQPLWHEINPSSSTAHRQLFASSQIQESLRGNGMTATCYACNAATGCCLELFSKLSTQNIFDIRHYGNKVLGCQSLTSDHETSAHLFCYFK